MSVRNLSLSLLREGLDTGKSLSPVLAEGNPSPLPQYSVRDLQLFGSSSSGLKYIF